MCSGEMSNRPSMLFAPFFRQPRPHSAFGTSRVAFAQICVMWYSTASSSRSEAIFHLGHFSCQEGRYEEAIRFSCMSALVTLLELLLSLQFVFPEWLLSQTGHGEERNVSA